MQKLTVDLDNLTLTSLDGFEYPKHEGRLAPYIKEIRAVVGAGVLHYVVWWYLMLREAVMPDVGSFLSPAVFTFALFVGLYISLAGYKYLKAIDAIDTITSTVESTGLQIARLEDEGRVKCHVILADLLRTIFATLKKMEIEITLNGEEITTKDHALVLKAAGEVFDKYGIFSPLIGGNGAINRFLWGRARSKSVTSVRLSASLKWCCIVTMCLLLGVFSIHLHGMELELWVQSIIFGVFAYVLWLMIAIANDLGNPYGQGRSKVALRERFDRYEELLKILCGEPILKLND